MRISQILLERLPLNSANLFGIAYSSEYFVSPMRRWPFSDRFLGRIFYIDSSVIQRELFICAAVTGASFFQAAYTPSTASSAPERMLITSCSVIHGSLEAPKFGRLLKYFGYWRRIITGGEIQPQKVGSSSSMCMIRVAQPSSRAYCEWK